MYKIRYNVIVPSKTIDWRVSLRSLQLIGPQLIHNWSTTRTHQILGGQETRQE